MNAAAPSPEYVAMRVSMFGLPWGPTARTRMPSQRPLVARGAVLWEASLGMDFPQSITFLASAGRVRGDAAGVSGAVLVGQSQAAKA